MIAFAVGPDRLVQVQENLARWRAGGGTWEGFWKKFNEEAAEERKRHIEAVIRQAGGAKE